MSIANKNSTVSNDNYLMFEKGHKRTLTDLKPKLISRNSKLCSQINLN